MYELLAKVAQRFDPPKARKLAAYSLKLASVVAAKQTPPALRREVMGLSFPSPVGLAAGFDKHGTLYPCLPPLGFGFAEIGSVIPLPEAQRSLGLDAVASILSRYPSPHTIPLGASISMNRMTLPERIANDYLICMDRLWKYADYITLNLGVRTGPDLHLPEHRAILRNVLAVAKSKQAHMGAESGLHRPLVVKIDQGRADTDNLLACVRDFCFDGLILSGDARKGEESVMLANLERAVKALGMPVISVGGIRTPQDCADRLTAGAALVQIYTGLVQSGPLLLRRINNHLMTTAGCS